MGEPEGAVEAAEGREAALNGNRQDTVFRIRQKIASPVDLHGLYVSIEGSADDLGKIP